MLTSSLPFGTELALKVRDSSANNTVDARKIETLGDLLDIFAETNPSGIAMLRTTCARISDYLDKPCNQITGSWQESGKVCVLRGFLKSDEFGSRGGHPLRFEQQVVEVAVTASAAQQRFDVAVDRLHHSQFDLGPAVVQDSLQVIDQHVRQLLHGL